MEEGAGADIYIIRFILDYYVIGRFCIRLEISRYSHRRNLDVQILLISQKAEE